MFKGTLEWLDLEGGFWAMTAAGKKYHFHGDKKLFAGVKAGDEVEIKGEVSNGVCVHMYGTIVNADSVVKSGGK